MSAPVPSSSTAAAESAETVRPPAPPAGLEQTPEAATGRTTSPRRRQARWRVGDVVEVWIGGLIRHRGVVEESAPTLGVVWIREHGTGLRLLIDLGEPGVRLRRCDSPQAPR